jgi:hypothetical protein
VRVQKRREELGREAGGRGVAAAHHKRLDAAVARAPRFDYCDIREEELQLGVKEPNAAASEDLGLHRSRNHMRNNEDRRYVEARNRLKQSLETNEM